MLESTQSLYGGRRILEAMHGAVRYSDAVFSDVLAAKPASADRILDFGAGDGVFADRFRQHGVAIDCLEPDPELHAGLLPKASAIYSRTSEIASSSFDFIYTINVLEHTTDIGQACAELQRIMRPGGTLFVFVPANEILWTSLDDEVGHVRRFCRASLRAVLQDAGFTIEGMKFFDSLGFAAALGVRLLEKLGLFRYKSENVRLYDRYLFPISRQLDHLLSGVLGKNLAVIARKPASNA